MTYDDAMTMVANSTRQDWKHLADDSIWVFKGDVNLRIERDREFEGDFAEPWTKVFPDKSSSMIRYRVCYGASVIGLHSLVSVDGGRADLPLPTAGTTSVRRDRYVVARIVDQQGDLDDYMQRAQLTVSG